jgi:flagellar biosynthesis protein FlhG
MQIVPLASGKGGVGKSLVACNLAVALGEAGKRVVLADLDLGGSNLHLMLGMRRIQHGIGTFLNGGTSSFNDIVLETDYENLRFVAGDAEIPGLANIGSAQKRKLINRLQKLDTDVLVLDLGAGTSFNILDFFLIAPSGIIVTTPTPTSMVNGYLFLKNAVFRLLSNACKRGSKGAEFLKKQTDTFQHVYLPQVTERLRSIDPKSYEAFQSSFQHFQPRLILNMLEDPKDSEPGNRLRRSVGQYLNVELEHLGVIYRDDLQDTALTSGLPIIRYKPNSVLAQAVYRLTDKITQIGEAEAAQPAWVNADQSFEEAEAEAQADFENKIDYVEELLHSGALSTGDLVETIKNQQIEISHLRKENMLYKSKLVKAMQQGFEA